MLPRAHKFPGQRPLRIALRTAHIGAAGLLLGAAHLGQLSALWPGTWGVLAGTGLGILADDVYRWRAHLPRMLQFWTLLSKLALVGIAASVPGMLEAGLWGALVIGSVVSHASGKLRHKELWGADGHVDVAPP